MRSGHGARRKSERGVCAILLGDDAGELRRDLEQRFPQCRLREENAELETLVSKVAGFLAAPATSFDVPLDLRGNAFQLRVWTAMVNRYEPGARLSLHQDRNERDFSEPIVSVSLGLPAVFLFGGSKRSNKTARVLLEHGDVVVWGGPARMR